jgi:hypothetical protein
MRLRKMRTSKETPFPSNQTHSHMTELPHNTVNLTTSNNSNNPKHLPTNNLFSLQHEIIHLENEFYSLYLYLSELTEEEYSEIYYLKESVLKDKYRLLELMTASADTPSPNIDTTSSHSSRPHVHQPYNPAQQYHIYSGCLRLISYSHTHTVPLKKIKYEKPKWGGQRPFIIDEIEPMLGDGRKRKKVTKVQQFEGNTATPAHTALYTLKPPPLSQLSDWVHFPPPKPHVAHTPHTAFSTYTTTTCQIGFSYCCHPFCLPAQSHNAFSLSFPPVTQHLPKPSIMFLTHPPAPTFQPISAPSSTQAHIPCNTRDTYNPLDPLAVWKCSNCRRDNFFCLTDNICCTCYKPRNAPNPRAPPRILYHDPDYFSDDDTTTTPFHRYTMYKEEPVYCDDDTLSWDTVSDSFSEESELGPMSCVDSEEYTVPFTPPHLPCNTYIHKTVHTQTTPAITSPQPSTLPLPDIV